jgi:arylformamidase
VIPSLSDKILATKEMTTIEINADHAYSPSRWSHRFDDSDKVIESHTQTLTKATQLARKTIPCLLNWTVNSTTSFPDHSIDIYFPSNITDLLPSIDTIKPKAIFVYLHGGYWQYFSRNESAFMAQTMSDAQILTAVIGYPIAPQATIDQIVTCVEQAIVKILQLAMKLSIKVFISGHSAGGHLGSTLLLIDWKTKYNIDPKIFGGFFLISGVFDLVPLVSTYINEPLGMTESIAKSQSPLHRDSSDYWLALKHIPILCVHAQYDPPTFHDQNRQYGSYLEKIGFDNVQILQLNDFDHFDIIEQLENQDKPLTRMILKLINASI